MSALVVWPSALGLSFFTAGLCTYRGDLFGRASSGLSRILSLGAVFIVAALATFAGEHFTLTRDLAQLVPKWLPQRVFITYFVGVALIAAALSFVARRCMRRSAPLLALIFALFVLLLHLPNAIAHSGTRIYWVFAPRVRVCTWRLKRIHVRKPRLLGAAFHQICADREAVDWFRRHPLWASKPTLSPVLARRT
jgi:uncharacterized membrane protein